MKNILTPSLLKVGIIPARSGSKRVPNKNFKLVGGKSLLRRAVEQAQSSGCLDLIIISSDDLELVKRELQESEWLKFHQRSAAASSDQASAFDVVKEIAVDFSIQKGICIYLQPTSPLRTSLDIKASLELFMTGDFHTVVSVSPVKSDAAWTLRVNGSRAEFIWPEALAMRSQDIHLFRLNGAIYINEISQLLERKEFLGELVGVHQMPEERSLDIDTLADWKIAETHLESEG